jgi:predicted enzyme related to lactoylglutathione lyase
MGRVIHFEIHSADLDRAQAFYTAVFGWKFTHWDGAPIDVFGALQPVAG